MKELKCELHIVGGALTGLLTAYCLSQLNYNIIISEKKKIISNTKKAIFDKRTTAISDTNFKFIRNNITCLEQKLFWPSKKIELFYETSKERINFLNLKETNSNLMYVFENDKTKSVLLKEIIKNKIKLIRKDVKNLEELKDYDLIVLCMGGKSKIYDKIAKTRSIKKDYKEIAITGYVKHSFKNLNTSQFFLKEGPLAILPFSKGYFSFVWSVKKSFFEKNLKKITSLIKNKLLEILENKRIAITLLKIIIFFLSLKYFLKE